MKEVNINPISFTSIPISTYLDETKQKLSDATALIYEYKDKLYLITNWHNVTGINPITKKQIGNHGGVPDKMELSLQIKNKKDRISWRIFPMKLYEDNKAGWLIHPKYKERIDVVAIEIEVSKNFIGIFRPINKVKFNNYKLKVSDDIFILGYPYRIKGGGELPIWKRGSVATEPDIDFDGLPKFLVDTSTKSGMSGSPVIFKRRGIHTKNGKLELDSKIGIIEGFVGIYSGRIIGKSELDPQLGIVWKKEVIEGIIEGNLKDDRTFN